MYKHVNPHSKTATFTDIGVSHHDTLESLRAWVDGLIAEHGAEARIDISSDIDSSSVEVSIVRAATTDEIAQEQERIAEYEKTSRDRRRSEYEKLKAEFEPST